MSRITSGKIKKAGKNMFSIVHIWRCLTRD